MAVSLIFPLLGLLLVCGCVATGPAVSKTDVGNLEINIKAPESVDVRYARIYVDDSFIGNMSATMSVLHLKRGKRVVRVEMDSRKTYREVIEILGGELVNLDPRGSSFCRGISRDPFPRDRNIRTPGWLRCNCANRHDGLVS